MINDPERATGPRANDCSRGDLYEESAVTENLDQKDLPWRLLTFYLEDLPSESATMPLRTYRRSRNRMSSDTAHALAASDGQGP
jgi:hypothetical protein